MFLDEPTARPSAGRQTTAALTKLLAERSRDLGQHGDYVTELCGRVADALGMLETERVHLIRAAALHDVGKAAIPDAVLEKPGPLDEEEWAVMRSHTLIGERILAAAPALARAAELVRSSHERFDGTGYPDGTAGDAIPLAARIIAVCDAFDAMTTPRPYRPTPLSTDEALAELREGGGTQFDSAVVAAFESAVALSGAAT